MHSKWALDFSEGQPSAGYKGSMWCFRESPLEKADLVVEQAGGGSS